MSVVENHQQAPQILQAATELAHRRSFGITGPLLDAALRPQNFEHAFAIQQAIAEQFKTEQNNPIQGWKCLIQTAEKTVVAPIYRKDIYQQGINSESSCPLYASDKGLARVEPELAFAIAEPLLPRQQAYSEAEIDAALGNTHLALELIKSRYENPSEANHFDALADGLVNQGLWIGPVLAAPEGTSLDSFEIKVEVAGAEPLIKQGVHPNGSPKAGLYWLVNFLSSQGIALMPGQFVITGSYAGVIDLPFDTPCQLQYGELGQFSLSFTRK
ncbi:hydratase [Shewanella sp. A25]|nr:hydratase [Shewanella shenzhenensis]